MRCCTARAKPRYLAAFVAQIPVGSPLQRAPNTLWPLQEGVATIFEEAGPGENGAAATADRGRALLHDPRIARLGFALQFVIQARYLRRSMRRLLVVRKLVHAFALCCDVFSRRALHVLND